MQNLVVVVVSVLCLGLMRRYHRVARGGYLSYPTPPASGTVVTAEARWGS